MKIKTKTNVDLEKAWNLILDALGIIPSGTTSCESVEKKYKEAEVLLDEAASLISMHFPPPPDEDGD